MPHCQAPGPVLALANRSTRLIHELAAAMKKARVQGHGLFLVRRA